MKTKIDTSTPEFQNALSVIRYTHNSLFLTGKAGTGKSTFLRYVCQEVKKKSIVLAPTGIAAINAGGSTLHSFFKIPFHPLVPDDPRFSVSRIRNFLKYSKQHIKLLNELELIIIDEISMVRADIIDFVDKVLRVYCHNMREPFGGKQVLLIGDVFQLEPVVKQDEREILRRFYPNPFFFSAYVFRQMRLVSIELTKVYRQKDAGFIASLDHVRSNQVSDLELRLFNTRYSEEEPEPAEGRLNILLATRRDTVDHVNDENLRRLKAKSHIFKGKVKGDFPDSSLPTLMELELKEGAQIIFVKNDADKRWVNGTLGTIIDIKPEDDIIEVETEDGDIVEVNKEKWSNVRYSYNEKEKKIEEEEIGTFVQYPIRLAWAITIHKSQGLTFQQVTIDFAGGAFAGGQVYVALSRCTSLEGITLRQQLRRSDIFVRPEVVNFARDFNNQQALEEALMATKADTEYRAAAQAFDQGDMDACLKHFFVAIHTRYDIEQPVAKRFIRRKLNVYRRLREEHDRMREALLENEEKLRKLADEYIKMGDECVTQAHNNRAAVANFSKAIYLDDKCVEAYIRRGITHYDSGDSLQAMHDLNQAIAIAPGSFKAYFNRGKIRLELGHVGEAVADLDKASSLNPKNARTYQLLGDAFARMGDEEKAAIYWAIAEQQSKKGKKK